jgi:hypothetical protein
MSLVGDVVTTSRTIIPDACQVLPAPSGFAAAQGIGVIAMPAGTYNVSCTLLTQWGESTATVLSPVIVDATHGISITGSLPVGSTKLRVYYGIGAVNQYQDISSFPAAVIVAPGTAGVPPTTNRAYLPDTDGGYASAYTLYQWLNEGLDKATDISGGILDYTGVTTVVNQPLYTLTNKWIKLTTGWFDGYLVFGGDKRAIFRRSPISAISAINVNVTQAPNSIVEIYPQPNRTAAVLTSTGSTLTTTGTSINYTTVSGALLTSFGLALLGGNTSSGGEIVYYSGDVGSTTLSNLVRGLGGTQPQSWPAGTQINELNLFFAGYRRAVKHAVGDSAKTLLIPPGWESLLPRYIEARYRQSEHEWKVAADLMKSFETEIKTQQAAYKVLSGPVQIQDSWYDSGIGDVFGRGLGGGYYVP